MPYALIPMLAAIGLGIRYVALGDASPGSKVSVAVAVAVSLAIWWRYPQWMVAAILIQVAVSLFVLLYLKVHPDVS